MENKLILDSKHTIYNNTLKIFSENSNIIEELLPSEYSNIVKELINFNDKIYEKLERPFLIKNSNETGEIKVIDLYNEIVELRPDFRELKLLESYSSFFENIEFDIEKSNSIFEYFKLVDEEINEYNEILQTKLYGNKILFAKHFKSRQMLCEIRNNKANCKKNDIMPQVFLSYAFADRLLSLCLFIVFYVNGIFLYVDWLCNNEMNDGNDIKSTLSKEIKKSDQFLFLQTVNSQLRIKGHAMIRGWCSWEMGAFYNVVDKDEKFFIKFYDRPIKYHDSLQMDGLKKFNGINKLTKKIF